MLNAIDFNACRYPLSSYQLGRRAYVKILHEIAAASGVQSPAGGTTAEKEEL